MGSENVINECAQNADNGFGFDFLEQCDENGDGIFSRIVTGDGTLVSFVSAETREQSKQRMLQTSRKSLNDCLPESRWQLFWDKKGVQMVEFIQQGTTVTS
jgi:hypothetical protein